MVHHDFYFNESLTTRQSIGASSTVARSTDAPALSPRQQSLSRFAELLADRCQLPLDVWNVFDETPHSASPGARFTSNRQQYVSLFLTMHIHSLWFPFRPRIDEILYCLIKKLNIIKEKPNFQFRDWCSELRVRKLFTAGLWFFHFSFRAAEASTIYKHHVAFNDIQTHRYIYIDI